MTKNQSEYKIDLETSDPSLLVNLFGNELPAEGTEFE